MSPVRIVFLWSVILIPVLPVVTSGSNPILPLQSHDMWFEGDLKLGATIQVVARVKNESMFEDSIYVYANYESAGNPGVARGDTGRVMVLECGDMIIVRLPITITEPGQFRIQMGTYRWSWFDPSFFPRGVTQTLLLEFGEGGYGKQVKKFSVTRITRTHGRRRPTLRRGAPQLPLITDPDSAYRASRTAESVARYSDSVHLANRIRKDLAISRSDADFDLHITGKRRFGTDDSRILRDYNAVVCPFEGDRVFMLQLGLHLPMDPQTWSSTSSLLRARIRFSGETAMPDTGVYTLNRGELIFTHQKQYPHPRWTNFFKYVTSEGHMVIDRTTKDSVYGVIVFFAQAEDYVLRRVTVDYREPFPPDAIHVSARFAAKVSAWPAHPIVDTQKRRVHALHPPR